jgi:hypothetical protein
LRQAEASLPVKELCRKHGFSDASICEWRARFGGTDVDDAVYRHNHGPRKCPGYLTPQEVFFNLPITPLN